MAQTGHSPGESRRICRNLLRCPPPLLWSAAVETSEAGPPGAADISADQIRGTPQLCIDVDRTAIARYGLSVDEVQEVVAAAVGGEPAGQVFDGSKRWQIVVRFAASSSANFEHTHCAPGADAVAYFPWPKRCYAGRLRPAGRLSAPLPLDAAEVRIALGAARR